MDIKKYMIGDTEIHMIGYLVGVCWNCREEEKKIVKDGLTYKAIVMVRKGKPYIDFINLRDDGDGGTYIDDDSSVDGGLSREKTLEIIDELTKACEYIEEISNLFTPDEISPPLINSGGDIN